MYKASFSGAMEKKCYDKIIVSNPIKISIIAPVYGVECYIERFAESILSQTYPNIEFIFVNDGTKDKSIDILEKLIERKYAFRREHIKIIHKQNGGLPAARRSGLECATGDYVYNVDSDDWLAEEAIQRIADTIVATNADIVYFNFIKEYNNKSKLKKERHYSLDQKELYLRNMYIHKSFGSLCNKCIRRKLYTENDIFTPRYGYAEDCCVTTQLVGYAKSIAYLDDYLYHYRKGNPSAMTSQKVRKRKKEYALNILDLYEAYMDMSKEKNPISVICDDIVIQAGWYSLLYGLGLFDERPYLAEAILKAHVRRGSNVFLPAQLLVKLAAFFK